MGDLFPLFLEIEMATVWNGIEMLENLTDKQAEKMVEKDEGQWLEQHDGSAFKERKEFTGYQNKAMETEKTKAPKKAVKKTKAKK